MHVSLVNKLHLKFIIYLLDYESGQDHIIVDPDVHKIYSKRKQHEAARKDVTLSTSVVVEYPSDGRSSNLT